MKNLFIFAAGAAIGSVVTWKVVEKYYKDLADEEIESVIETFKNREKENKKAVEEKVEDKETEKENKRKKKDKEKHAKLVNSLNYGEADISTVEDKLINKSVEDIVSTMIISPEEFGEKDEYDTKSWMLWHDGVLTNEFDEIVEDPESIIGDALSHFGEYEDDSVYVRNNDTQTDIEILQSEKEFNA